MDRQQDEMNRLFEETYDETMKENKEVREFIRVFDIRFDQYLDTKEQGLRAPIERMIDDFRMLAIKWKHQQYDKLKQNNVQQNSANSVVDVKDQIIEMQKELNQIASNHEDVINQTQTIIEQKQEIQNEMIRKYVTDTDHVSNQSQAIVQQKQETQSEQKQETQSQQKQETNNQSNINYHSNTEYVRELKECNCGVRVEYVSKLDEYRKQIMKYEVSNKKYRIEIDFYSNNIGIDGKIKIIKMLDELNANNRVAKIDIKLSIYNQINEEIAKMMLQKYQNVYYIGIDDNSNQVDNVVHNLIKKLVEQSTLLCFRLKFYYGSLAKSDKGLQLIKEYNNLVQQKQCLEYLNYDHHSISKYSKQKEQIQSIINEVNKM